MTASTNIPVAKLADGVRLALESGRRLAVAAAAAADAGEPHAAAVLLYQAAEEVGKAKLLKNHLDVDQPIAESMLRDHSRKFRLAVEVVPADCLELWPAAFDPRIFDPRIFQTEPIMVDWDRRQDSLYLNWDPAAGEWDVPAAPDQRVVRASAARMVSFIDSSLKNGLP